MLNEAIKAKVNQ